MRPRALRSTPKQHAFDERKAFAGALSNDVLGGEAKFSRQEIACAAFDCFAELGFEVLDREFEFGRDGGEADVAIKPRKQAAVAGAGLDDVRNCRHIMTHGHTRQNSYAPPPSPRRADEDKLNEIG